jgi:hypothetical protein
VIFDAAVPEMIQAQERLMQRLIDENADLKKKYD